MAISSEVQAVSDTETQKTHANEGFPLLLLGALGVVYGDIGTSPIYAFREALAAAGGDGRILRVDILGVISMIFWALTLVVTLKYVVFVLRADNKGEGGILSLMALARSHARSHPRTVTLLGICGAALFFGDAVITPSISVLSAIEGFKIVAPDLEAYVVPVTLLVLITLFAVQRFGTGKVAAVFGPITALWFLALGYFGLVHIFDDPTVLYAINPYYAFEYAILSPATTFAVVGAIFLAVTGAEALYADLGHFGRRPIVVAWLAIVFPCLLLNYFGQGAFVLAHEHALENPFYQMFPQWALLPMVLLATAATVIASQAVITGAFSLARQAAQLKLLPRLDIRHTSAKQFGQIYVPRINLLLCIVVIALVVGFGESGNLASAYGIAVTGNMIVTSILLAVVMMRVWNWGKKIVVPLILGFLVFDFLFFTSNLSKLHEGGWVSILMAICVMAAIIIWQRGSQELFERTRRSEIPIEVLVKQMSQRPPLIVPGTAVFLTGDATCAPTALMHSLKHYKVLHEKNVILTVETTGTPRVPADERASVSQFSERFMQVTLRFGYMEEPNVPRALASLHKLGWKFDIMTTSFFLSRRSLRTNTRYGRKIFDRIFITFARSAADATEYFRIPTGRVVEIGMQVTL
ncbi:potassium transporter Kup [Limoniibacter endophyticus]|uniref:Probable potassium transport system protein Kup n=1 Tax=Limoniibacter endophyticus TaxID=1565040 RepID=A0A8J3DIN8_9HYPH|nr:potassium transporter Kup [Limoniibacter endophyticus]GHC75415.1 putative potassium transport system protein kup [Limoniibacter endophyticus]